MNLTQLLAPYTVSRVPATQPWAEYQRRTRPQRLHELLSHYTLAYTCAA